VPERAYQVDIINTALLQNTLVCLPTGLGKTLIAAVIMHNFTRWFPEVLLQPHKMVYWKDAMGCMMLCGAKAYQTLLHTLLYDYAQQRHTS